MDNTQVGRAYRFSHRRRPFWVEAIRHFLSLQNEDVRSCCLLRATSHFGMG
jgi:hypothetical protein